MEGKHKYFWKTSAFNLCDVHIKILIPELIFSCFLGIVMISMSEADSATITHAEVPVDFCDTAHSYED